jgi:hypothetical protein
MSRFITWIASYSENFIMSHSPILGLVMAKEIIDLHGGEVLFKSELGESWVPLCAVLYCVLLCFVVQYSAVL